jgi:hypothetical protein
MTMTDERIVEFPALTEAQAKLDAKRQGLKSVLDEAGPNYDMSMVKSLSGDTAAKVAEIGKMNAEIDDCKKKVDEYLVVARAAAKSKDGDTAGAKVGGSDPGHKGGQPANSKSLGQLMVDGVAKRDVPLVQACGLIFAVTYVGLNLLADILAIASNPRLRHPK